MFHEKIFDENPFFAISKMGKPNFGTGKKTKKLTKMQFHEISLNFHGNKINFFFREIDLFDFTSFLSGLF